jgi:two-component system response regulator AtoC
MLVKAGYSVLTLNDSKVALDLLKGESDLPDDPADFDVLVTDLYMPEVNGMELLSFCQSELPDLPVIMMTAFGTVESAVTALKNGAFDFVTKPFDQTELLHGIQKAVETRRQQQKEPVTLRALESNGPSVSGASISTLIGQSPQMQEVFRIITKIAASPSTVLIQGESGTGKELVAFEIHKNSQRTKKPFIKVNCAAIPSTLIESELFGYERGAFTGAVNSKPGRFELAHEGTLFLDEVGEMPLEMQVKLLRVLQEQEFERVGGVNTVKVDVRIITATNRDLDFEVKAGRFREDLFYRLNVVPIHLPPLRERRADFDLLLKFFLNQFNQRLGKSVEKISPLVLDALRSYSWPGNIRQLENVLERMLLMSDTEVLEVADLPPEIAKAAGLQLNDGSATNQSTNSGEVDGLSFRERVKLQTQNVERDLIERALDEMDGNVTRTAEKLGLSRKGLQLKMKELGLKRLTGNEDTG